MAVTSLKLTYDELDDLIYYSRTGDLSALQDSIKTLSQNYSCPPTEVIRATIDVDEEGLGSGSCLLHYPAANGNIEIVRYVLDQTISAARIPKDLDEKAETQENAPKPSRTCAENQFINHRNVSGNTALHWAGMNGHLEIVKILLAAGADPEVLNAAGRDAVVESEWSSKDGAADCAVWMLKECGALEKTVGEEHEEDSISADQETGGSNQAQDPVQDSDEIQVTSFKESDLQS